MAAEEGRQPVCKFCRGQTLPVVTEADRRYWLERYSLAEIQEMAAAVWPGL